MNLVILRLIPLALSVALVAALQAQQATPLPNEEEATVLAFVEALEAAVSTDAPALWTDLLSANADRGAALAFFEEMVPDGVTQAVVRVRDRQPLTGALPGEGFQLAVDVFFERGARGRIDTWSLDIRRPRSSTDAQPWRLVRPEKLATIDGLHRLGLSPDKQFAARDVSIKSIDFELRLPSGQVFVAETAEGVTGIVLLGEGMMTFAPKPEEERGQVRLFAGSDTLQTPFGAAFIRMSPFEFDQQVRRQLGQHGPVDARAWRQAQVIFDDEVGKSFSLDLRDLSRENWSLLPQPGDVVAEVRTRRFSTITYARAMGQPEDVTLFHRGRQRNIAAYASEMKLASRGRFYNEDDLVEYDVVDHSLDLTFSPSREWLEGQSKLRLRVRSYALAAFTLRLASEFTVSSVTSDTLGRLMFLRVRNQNDVIVNLPAPVPRNGEMTLTIAYAGPIRTQPIDQETVEVTGQEGGRAGQMATELPMVAGERNWLFSNRSQWYPQNQVSDYASASIRFTVPADYKVVATGLETDESPVLEPAATGTAPRATYVFSTSQPVRYIGAVISKFVRVDRASVALDVDGARNTVMLAVDANRRQMDRGRDVVPVAADILRLYASLVGEAPFDALTIAMVEHERPGGHSPGYFAVLNNPLPLSPWSTRRDPAAFTNFPEFFAAHEIAHQWWGQAVGWKNYHEQWLSEGLSQYFAALYAHERRGDQTFRDVIRQLRRWAMDQSDQGPVYLGYRLGHLKNDSRVFRAVVYNKGAAVLHMLRRWIGDEAFFRGLRRYYRENQFRKAGTEDLQRAMEAESDVSLDRFFDRWIYGSALPRVRYSTTVIGGELVVKFEQTGPVFDIPTTVAVQYADQTTEVVVAITAEVVERRFPLSGPVRAVEVNADGAALAHFERR